MQVFTVTAGWYGESPGEVLVFLDREAASAV